MMHHKNWYACHGNVMDINKKKAFKSKNVLDIRMVPGHPQRAWIECYENSYDEDAQIGIAEYHAQRESEKLSKLQAEREAKLKVFQEEVAKRVSNLQRLKRREVLRKSMKRIEDEQTVVLQRTLGMKVPYRGTAEDLHALNKELLKSCIIPCSINKNLIQCEVEESNRKVKDYSQQIKSEISKAKASLLSKKLDTDLTVLPGGAWSESTQKQNDESSPVNIYPPKQPPPVPDAWTGKDAIKSCVQGAAKQNIKENVELSHDCDVAKEEEVPHVETLKCCSKDEDDVEDEDVFSLGLLQKNLVHDPIVTGFHVEQERSQRKNQYWKYRKIFMDIEREQARERRRRDEHKRKVEKLKISKERERELTEEQITEFPEKTLCTEDGKSLKMKSSFETKGDEISSKDKAKELYRYVEALREVARERIKLCNIYIPPLCQCGPTVWDAHPDRCANNCVFYKNPKYYVQALTTALANTR